MLDLVPKPDTIVKDLTSQLEGDKINGEMKMAVSQALVLVLRLTAKKLADGISK